MSPHCRLRGVRAPPFPLILTTVGALQHLQNNKCISAIRITTTRSRIKRIESSTETIAYRAPVFIQDSKLASGADRSNEFSRVSPEATTFHLQHSDSSPSPAARTINRLSCVAYRTVLTDPTSVPKSSLGGGILPNSHTTRSNSRRIAVATRVAYTAPASIHSQQPAKHVGNRRPGRDLCQRPGARPRRECPPPVQCLCR